jgi:hypothetical protein
MRRKEAPAPDRSRSSRMRCAACRSARACFKSTRPARSATTSRKAPRWEARARARRSSRPANARPNLTPQKRISLPPTAP